MAKEEAKTEEPAEDPAGRTIHKNLAQAMRAVYQEVDYIQKKKSPEGGVRYTYAAEADIVGALHPQFAKHGIYLCPTGWKILHNVPYATAKGSEMFHVIVEGTFTFRHADSEESVQVVSLGEASDIGDKAIPKAQTSAFKYCLRQTFCLETGDDPDKDSSEGKARGVQGKSQARQQQQTQGGRDTTAREPAKQGQGPNLAEVYGKASRAMVDAPSLDLLEKYLAAAKGKGFTKEQMDIITGLYNKRKNDLSPPEKKQEEEIPF